MFFIAGIDSKIRECPSVPNTRCPVCSRDVLMHVCNKYMTPTLFFIPTFRFRSSYLATCPACASLMELDAEKGKALERDPGIGISPGDLRVVQDNALPICPRCGRSQPRGASFCNGCGERL